MIRLLINAYILLIIVDAVLSYFPKIRRERWALYIKKYSDFTLRPIRRYLPQDMPFDVSPIIVIVILKFFEAIW